MLRGIFFRTPLSISLGLRVSVIMVESRRAPRQRVLKAGTIEFGGGAIDCLVRNLSTTGAALEISSQVGIPERFSLILPGVGLHLGSHIVWRKGYRIGIAFD
jgi:PilZ domain